MPPLLTNTDWFCMFVVFIFFTLLISNRATVITIKKLAQFYVPYCTHFYCCKSKKRMKMRKKNQTFFWIHHNNNVHILPCYVESFSLFHPLPLCACVCVAMRAWVFSPLFLIIMRRQIGLRLNVFLFFFFFSFCLERRQNLGKGQHINN